MRTMAGIKLMRETKLKKQVSKITVTLGKPKVANRSRLDGESMLYQPMNRLLKVLLNHKEARGIHRKFKITRHKFVSLQILATQRTRTRLARLTYRQDLKVLVIYNRMKKVSPWARTRINNKWIREVCGEPKKVLILETTKQLKANKQNY